MSKKLTILAASAAILSMAAALPVGAEMNSTTTASSSVSGSYHMSHSGHITLRGTVSAISGDTVTILANGRTWIVNLMSKAHVLARHNHKVTLANVKVGDKVMVQGTVQNSTSTSSSTVSARILQDLSLNEKKATVHGVISALSADFHSLVLTLKNGKTVNVTLNSDTSVRNGSANATLSSLANGMTVNISGLLNRDTDTLLGAKVNTAVNATTTKVEKEDNDEHEGTSTLQKIESHLHLELH